MEMEYSSLEQLSSTNSFALIIIVVVVLISVCYSIYLSSSSSRECLNVFGLIKDLSGSLCSPNELISIVKMKYRVNRRRHRHREVSGMSLDQLGVDLNDLDFCYATLNKVSRSFAIVIEELPNELKDVVCIFYLILRGLDTIEDDENYPREKKEILLRNFHSKLFLRNWSIENVGDTKDYQILLKYFPKVTNIFQSFDHKYQLIIMNITKQMGHGMADFLCENQIIDRKVDYNLYCHYVAGLVGQGLSSLFVQSGLESLSIDLHQDWSNSMGLFLQKTNIIRDYLEDLQAQRHWWPKEIWMKYVSNLCEFNENPLKEESLECLNEMIIDSLEHLQDVIKYLRLIENKQILQFCAIPQLMALATLTQCYQNPFVFTSIVKIRKGLTCQLMINSSNLINVYSSFYSFLQQIEKKIPSNSTQNTQRMKQLIEQIKLLLLSSFH